MRNALYILGPLAMLLAVIVVAALALFACAALPVFGQWLPGYCPAAAATATTEALERQWARREALKNQLRVLERELLALGPCPRPTAPPEPQQRAEPADTDAIDPERWREQDISLFEGCWQLDSDYSVKDINTREVYTVPDWRVCFDAEGRGQQHFRLSNGAQCSGAMSAQFAASGTMTLADDGDVACSRNWRVFERSGTCRLDAANRAFCELRSSRGGGKAKVRFRRGD